MLKLQKLFDSADYRVITPFGVIAIKGIKAVLKTALGFETTKVSVRVSKTPGYEWELQSWSVDQGCNIWFPMEPV